MSSRSQRARRDGAYRWIGLGGLGAAVFSAPMWMAGTTPGGALVVAVVGPLAAFCAQRMYGAHAPVLRHPALAAFLGIASLVAVQALVLPIVAVEVFFPAAADATRRAALLTDTGAAYSSLSLAPVETRRELAEALSLACVFVAAWCVSAGGDRRAVVRLVALSIAAVAAVSLGHTILDVRRPFGVLPEPFFSPAFIGPVLNENMLGGLLGAGVPVAISCGLGTERRDQRLPWLALGAGLALMSAFCRSRGALLSLAVGVIALVLLLRRRSRAPQARNALALGAGLTAIAAMTAFAFVGEAMIAETRRGVPKLQIFVESLEVVLRAPWTGVGRGAFAAAFVGIRGGLERAEHPENLVIQWAAELGVVGIGALLVLGAALVSAARSARSPAQCGAIAGVISFVVHDQFDFALELGGIAVVASALLGAALAPRKGDGLGLRGEGRRAPPAAFGLVAMVALPFLAPSMLGDSMVSLRDEALAALRARELDRADAIAVRGVRLHPAEPVFPLIAAHSALLQGRADVPRWLNRAIELAPGWYEPHRLAARWLVGRGALEQAWLEVREVRRIEPTQGPRAGCAVARAAGSAAAAIRILALDLDLLDAMVACSQAADAEAIERELVARRHPAALIRAARRATALGHPADALEVLSGAGDDDGIMVARAEALRRTGRAEEALNAVSARMRERPSAELAAALARACAAADQPEAMRTATQQYLAMGDGSSAALARQRLLLGELEAALGNTSRALRAYEEANDADPNSGALDRLLTLARASGDERRAEQARRGLCRRDGPDSPHCSFERFRAPAQRPRYLD